MTIQTNARWRYRRMQELFLEPFIFSLFLTDIHASTTIGSVTSIVAYINQLTLRWSDKMIYYSPIIKT